MGRPGSTSPPGGASAAAPPPPPPPPGPTPPPRAGRRPRPRHPPPAAPVLPGEELVGVEPARVPGDPALALAHQREVGHRDDARALRVFEPVSIAVAEGVELLDVAELEPGLLVHPAAQPAVERAIGLGLQGTKG